MSRNARNDLKGYYYHVIARGQRKNPIFFSNSDFAIFMKLLKNMLIECDTSIMAFCLMRNHYHLLLLRDECPMEFFMRKLQTRYAMYFNRKYELVGHVFQGRYKSRPVLNLNYLNNVVNYIEYNPVNAGLTAIPEEYVFSSANIETVVQYDLQIINYKPTGSSTDFPEFRDAIGTEDEFIELHKRSETRQYGKNRRRRKGELHREFKKLLIEQGVSFDIFFKKRNNYEKKIVKEFLQSLIFKGFSQSEIARYLKKHRSTIHRMLK